MAVGEDVLDSIYGHDAFLKEVEALRPVLVGALETDGGRDDTEQRRPRS